MHLAAENNEGLLRRQANESQGQVRRWRDLLHSHDHPWECDLFDRARKAEYSFHGIHPMPKHLSGPRKRKSFPIL